MNLQNLITFFGIFNNDEKATLFFRARPVQGAKDNNLVVRYTNFFYEVGSTKRSLRRRGNRISYMIKKLLVICHQF